LQCGQPGQPACPAQPTATPTAPPRRGKAAEAIGAVGAAAITRLNPYAVGFGLLCLAVASLATGVQTLPRTEYVTVPMELVPAPQPATSTPMPLPGLPPTPTTGPEHRGVIQIQGPDINARDNPASVDDTLSWNWPTSGEVSKPPTSRRARQELARLWNQLTSTQQNRRKQAYDEAVQWLIQVRDSGGVTAPVSKSFRNRGEAHVRIDIVVHTGRAFVP